MYESHFGLRQRPFRSTLDVARYYPATAHESALQYLRQAVQDEEALVLLTGEPGLGKSLLGRCLLQQLGPEVRSACLTNSHLPDRVALFQAILYELSLPYDGCSEQELRLALTDSLLSHCGQGQSTLLIVDDAQHLSPDLIEELRLLLNLEGSAGRALQIILTGQSSLLGTLDNPGLASCRQRAVRATLEPLTPAEAADYLLHHLRAATDRPEKILGGESLELLARGSRGVPRLLNQSAHRALSLAYAADADIVDAEAALEALAALGLNTEEVMEEAA